MCLLLARNASMKRFTTVWWAWDKRRVLVRLLSSFRSIERREYPDVHWEESWKKRLLTRFSPLDAIISMIVLYRQRTVVQCHFRGKGVFVRRLRHWCTHRSEKESRSHSRQLKLKFSHFDRSLCQDVWVCCVGNGLHYTYGLHSHSGC